MPQATAGPGLPRPRRGGVRRKIPRRSRWAPLAGRVPFPVTDTDILNALPGVDLHTHSTASDGTLTPADVVRLAAEAGLSAVALTDHDTVAGVAEAASTAAEVGIDFLSGIEVTAAFPRPGTMHLLAYGFDPGHPAIVRLTGRLGTARDERAEQIVGRLNRLGLDVTLAEVRAEAGGGSIGRPHVARVLIRRGHAVSTRDAFDRLLGSRGAAWVDTAPLEAGAVIEHVRAAGGLVSAAHPRQLRRRDPAQLAALVAELADQGMEGLETMHGTHDADTVRQLTRLADRLGLVPTGGSDYHGPHKPWVTLGLAAGRPVPRAVYDEVAARVGGGVPATSR